MSDTPRVNKIDAETKGKHWIDAYRILEKEAGRIERELAEAKACLETYKINYDLAVKSSGKRIKDLEAQVAAKDRVLNSREVRLSNDRARVEREIEQESQPVMKETADESIIAERKRQDTKWGVQDHSAEWWLAILTEEVGELAQAILESHFDNGPEAAHLRGVDRIRAEAVQCAAVAKALIECIDRQARGT